MYSRQRFRQILCFVLLFLTLTLIANFLSSTTHTLTFQYDEFNITDGTCSIPKEDPLDPEILKFNWHPKPLSCAKWKDLVYVTNDGVLHLNQSAIQHVGSNITCSYQIIRRKTDFIVELNKKINITSSIYIPADFFYVSCTNLKRAKVYGKIHMKADFKSVRAKRKLVEETNTNVSVFLFGVDSMSRLAAERRLPQTMKVLKSLPGSYIFQGYTKVEESTFVNLVPVLTGKQPIPKLVNISSWKEHLDSIPFMWKDFKAKGMPILYAEDWVQYGTFALQKGFKNPIFDHYMRPFLLAVNKVHSTNIDGSHCYTNMPKHQTIIEYLKKFIDGYDKEQKFSLTWINSLSHDEPNYLELADRSFAEFFSWLGSTKHLERAVLIFFSDHGPRISARRNTNVGRIEDRMPLLSIVIPRVLTSRFPHLIDALQTNTQRLATAYDLHETLVKLLNSDFIMEKDFQENDRLPRGISLFRKIPEKRSCSDAFIKEEFCPCYKSHSVSSSDWLARDMARHVLDHINNILKGVTDKCHILNLQNIENVNLIFTNRKSKSKPNPILSFVGYYQSESRRYLVIIRTSPGRALFEASIQTKGQHFEVLGDVIRINKYGSQSVCMSERFLRSYCFCKSNTTLNDPP